MISEEVSYTMINQLLDGLYLYEITLLILGTLLFLVLIVLLIVKVVTRQPIKVLIPFFIIPILMIGFPGIEQFNFMNGMAELKTKINRAIDEPENEALMAEIQESVERYSARPVRNPQNLIIIGEAYEILDRSDEAKNVANTVLDKQPDFSPAIQLRERIEVNQTVERVQKNPDDQQAKRELEQRVSSFAMTSEPDLRSLLSIARAYNVLGDTSKAEIFADSVTIMRPHIDGRARLRQDSLSPDR